LSPPQAAIPMVNAVMLAAANSLRSMLISIPLVGGSDDLGTTGRYFSGLHCILGANRRSRIRKGTDISQAQPKNHVRKVIRAKRCSLNCVAVRHHRSWPPANNGAAKIRRASILAILLTGEINCAMIDAAMYSFCQVGLGRELAGSGP
jgi:hypothetical protein